MTPCVAHWLADAQPVDLLEQWYTHGSALVADCMSVQYWHSIADAAGPAGFPADEARVVFAGKQLEASALLSAYGVEQDSTVDILGRLLGGAKKRKKKTYTKPKKNKHKHKSVKLRVLKYYKVDDSGKVERLRKVCPKPDCGAGIFMATHHDRVYCGKCGMTFKYDTSAKA